MGEDSRVTEPRYRAIAADLAAKIRDGTYAPGQPLPSQRELSISYGVALMTLRQAIQMLTENGLVTAVPGKGTCVAAPHLALYLGFLRSLVDDLRRQGHDVRTSVLSRSVRRAPDRVTGQLRIRPGDTALRLERLREFAGRPAIHQVSWIRQPYGDGIRDRDFSTLPLYGALADAGVAVARATETVRPGLLDAAIARHLGEPAGSAVFVSDRITYALNGAALVADRATILGSMMEIRTERAATGLSLNWGAAS
jgi:GntR family transcriptional regulator